MGVNLLASRHRMMTLNPRSLPPAYQQVDYLFRSNSHVGPYSQVSLPIATGDVITIRVKGIDLSGESAFAGNPNTDNQVELYYQKNTKKLVSYPSARVVRSDQSYQSDGDEPDVLIVTAVADFTLLNWGVYRTTNYYFNGKMFSMTIVGSNGLTKHNFVACYRKADNVPGFYDTQTQTFYTSDDNSGSWVLPADYET